MQGMDIALGARLVVTDQACRAMSHVSRSQGPHVVVLAWPGGATCLPLAAYSPSKYDVVVGHIAGSPIYADMRRLGWASRGRVVLDIVEMPRAGRRPLLRVRPTARARPPAQAASDADARIADELYREFGESMPDVVIRACLANALADLVGSISQEGLPEMAVRLARVRLAARLDTELARAR
jgi:uncharacterized protein (DUF779 family)